MNVKNNLTFTIKLNCLAYPFASLTPCESANSKRQKILAFAIIFLQELSKFLVVGFAEELVYRGFGLNMLLNFSSGRTANVVSSLFFAAVHIPAYFIHWYCDSVFSLTEMITQVITAFIFGLLFGIVFL